MFRVELLDTGKTAPRSRYPKLLKSAGEAPVQYDYEDDEDDEDDEDEEDEEDEERDEK